MNVLNEYLKTAGLSKTKTAKILKLSRQQIYNLIKIKNPTKKQQSKINYYIYLLQINKVD